MWRVLLSEYPESLLSDELALTILSLLEQRGMLREDELADLMNVGRGEITAKLLALQKNRMVEYAKMYLKPTDRAKILLDRFDLGDEITSDLIVQLNVDETAESKFREVFASYRRHAFSHYLNSMAAIRSWSHVCRILPMADTEIEACTREGILGILCMDIAETGLVSRPRDFFLHLHGHHHAATALAPALPESPSERVDEVATPLDSGHSLERNLFRAHQVSRRVKDFEAWFSDWKDGDTFASLSKCRTVESMLQQTFEIRISLIGKEPDREVQTVLRLKSVSDEELRERLQSFLPHLMIAGDLKSLSILSGLGEEILISLVQNVQDRCRNLLTQQSGSKPEDGGDCGSAPTAPR